MTIPSRRVVNEVSREFRRAHGLRPRPLTVTGAAADGRPDPLSALPGMRRRRCYAMQQSINVGGPYVFRPAPGLGACVLALEDRRMLHGALLLGEVRVPPAAGGIAEDRERRAGGRGAGTDGDVSRRIAALPEWSEARLAEAGAALGDLFYRISGWRPDLMEENRLKALRQAQIEQAVADRRASGDPVLYAFEKERMLLAHIRAGDRSEARSLLNDMLAAIYMNSPGLVVLRARTVELISCLTRAAIEDNPLLEPLIERTHRWTERLIRARDFEDVSRELMAALDDFMDGVYLHGSNRSNPKVRKALDYVGEHFARGIPLAELAGVAGLSPSRLSRLVREYTGRTVTEIVREVRIRQAQRLLTRTSKSCAEIGYEVGFGDQSYFIKHFRRLVGTTPARYRRPAAPSGVRGKRTPVSM